MTPSLRRKGAALAALFLLSGPLSLPARAYSDLPDLGEAADSALTPQGERALGLQVMRQLRASGGYLEDPEVNGYLTSLGQRLVAGIPNSHPDFTFFAVGSPEINAFALPGGFVGVNTGLILSTQSESELASVLAHEISHVTQRHIARQLASASGSQALSMAALLAALLVGRAGGGQAASAAVMATTAAQAQSQINYTREHEREADRIGFSLLDKAGFDSRSMAIFFGRLQVATRTMESDMPSYLRSHPMTQERISDAQAREAAAPYRQVPDSADYQYVRALLHSYEGQPEEAVKKFSFLLQEKRYQSRDATRYGLAASLLRAKSFAKALKEIQALDRDGAQHPMIDAMAGQILQQAGQRKEAINRYERALNRYPQHLQLVYDYPKVLVMEHREADAARFVESRLQERPNDATLHQTAAEAYAALGRPFLYHRHLGEYQLALGDNSAALEQFDLAVRSGDGSRYEIQAVESRMQSLRDSQREAGRGQSGGRGRGPGG